MVNMKPKNFHLSHNWITFKLWKINHFRLCSDAHFVPFLFYYYCKWVRIWNEKWKQWPRKGYSYWDIYFSFLQKILTTQFVCSYISIVIAIYEKVHKHSKLDVRISLGNCWGKTIARLILPIIDRSILHLPSF